MWSAPNRRASSSRSGIWSITMTWAAPISLATAAALSPSPPAPWSTTVSPTRTRTRSSPYRTWARAQLTGVATSSEMLSGTRYTKWPGRR